MPTTKTSFPLCWFRRAKSTGVSWAETMAPAAFSAPDRWLRESHSDSQEKDNQRYHQDWLVGGKGFSHPLAQGHQAELEAFHEQHKAHDDRQERSGDSAKTFHRLAQEKELKGHQVECERRNGPELLEKSR